MSLDAMRRMIERSLGQIRQAFRAYLIRVITDGPHVLVQAEGLSGETLQDNELMQHFGFTSAPPAGTQCVVIPLGGKTAHGIVIATEHGSYRLKGLKSGEAALYDDQGQCVYLTRDGIVIKGAGKPVLITDTPKVRIEADLDVTGQVKDLCDTGGKTMADMRGTFNAHTHHENDSGGQTGTPSEEM